MAALPVERGRVRWREVLAAPWVGALNPRRAALVLIRASSGQFLLALLVTLSLAGAVMAWPLMAVRRDWIDWVVWDDPRVWQYWPPIPFVRFCSTVRFGFQGWAWSFATGAANAATFLLVILLIGVPPMLPAALGRRGAAKSIQCALRASVSAGGAATLLLGGVLWSDAFLRVRHSGGGNGWQNPICMVQAAAGCILCIWWSLAARAVEDEPDWTGVVPRCEECGYELPQLPSKGRCPECGEWVEYLIRSELSLRRDSLSCPRPGVLGWMSSTWRVLMMPSEFYRSVPVRNGLTPSRRFAFWHLLAMGVVGGLWWSAIMIVGGMRLDRLAGSAVPKALFVPMAAWILHRTVGGVIITGLRLRGDERDVACGRVIVAYETAWLWMVLLASGVMLSILCTRLIICWSVAGTGANAGAYWTNVRALNVTGGALYASATVVGLWRYILAWRAVKWANC